MTTAIMETSSEMFSVTDVYEHAASIGKDIEYIVNQYGKEAIEDIMPKIVYVLEQLERLTETHQNDSGQIQDLMMERDKLIIHSKRDEAIQRELEEKLSYMEGLVTKDKKELEQKLRLLREENENMLDELEKRDNELVKLRTNGGQEPWFSCCINIIVNGMLRFVKALPGDVEVMMRMKATIDGMRDQIRHLNHETQTQRKEMEALQEQTTRLTNINEELRAKILIAHSRLRNYESDVVDGAIPDEDINGNEVTGKPDGNSSCLSLHDELVDELVDEDELVSEKTNSLTDLTTTVSLTCDEQDEEKTPSIKYPEESSLDGSKRKDPNRPRYTLAEMQSMLEERNLYKIKMMALEEELQLYKDGSGRVLKASSEIAISKQTTHQKSGVRSVMAKFLGK